MLGEMRVLLERFFWKLRNRHNVRLQLANDAGAIDGILIGIVAGHYKLRNAFFYAHRPNSEGEAMLGETWVPTSRVFLLNVKD